MVALGTWMVPIALAFKQVRSVCWRERPALNPIMPPQIFAWLFFVLDFPEIIKLFALNINVNCQGSQLPWYMFANLGIAALVILLVSADLADPVCLEF